MPNEKSSNRRTLWILGAVGALAIMGSTMAKNPALPLLAASIGANDVQIGLIAAISPIPGILISAFAGALSDRKGRRSILFASLLIFATAPFLYLLVHDVWTLAAVRFYHGFATAIFMPVAMAAVADRCDSTERGAKLGAYSSATMAGRFIAPFMGGAMLYFANFQSLYLTCAITGIAALVMFSFIDWREGASSCKPKTASSGSMKQLRELVKDRRILITASVEGIQYYAMGAFEAFLPIFALSLGYNALEIGIIMGIQVASILLTKPFLGALSDKKGREPTIIFGLLAGAVAIAAIPFVSNFLLLCLLSLCFGTTVATVTSSTSALVSELGGQSSHGASLGFLSSLMDIGHSVGPLATGLLVSTISFKAGYAVAGALLVVGAVAFALAMWRMRKPR